MNEQEFRDRLWPYLLLTHDPAGFQSWVARHRELESAMESELYDAVITFPHANSNAERDVHDRLAGWARSSQLAGCPCSTWADDQRVPLGYETATLVEDWFSTLKERNPWLRLTACVRCGQRWYLAIDTVDDDHYFIRMSEDQVRDILGTGRWPAKFDTFKNVWPDPDYPPVSS